MRTICTHCGTPNNEEAPFCRGCGQPLTSNNSVVTNSLTKAKPAWFLFCRGLSLIVIIYGLFALLTVHSEVHSQSYKGDGHYDYVITEHSDAIGLIKCVGYGYSMSEGTPLDSIVYDSMNNGKKEYYAICAILIVIGLMLGGISSFIYHKKKTE